MLQGTHELKELYWTETLKCLPFALPTTTSTSWIRTFMPVYAGLHISRGNCNIISLNLCLTWPIYTVRFAEQPFVSFINITLIRKERTFHKKIIKRNLFLNQIPPKFWLGCTSGGALDKIVFFFTSESIDQHSGIIVLCLILVHSTCFRRAVWPSKRKDRTLCCNWT